MAADTSWTKLPSILIVEIFNYLDLTDRLNASITCKQWRSCIFHPVLWPRVIFDVKSGSTSNRNGPKWAEMDRNEPEWTGMERNGPKWGNIFFYFQLDFFILW